MANFKIRDFFGTLLGDSLVSGAASSTTTNNTQVIAAPGAGSQLTILSVSVANSSETDAIITLKSGTTPKYFLPAPAGGGAVHNLLLELGSNEALNFASDVAASTIYVSATGITS